MDKVSKQCKECNCKSCEQVAWLEQENERLKARLRPLEDSYFNGLSSIEIAGLAKKSIRITAENRKLEDALQEIREYCGTCCHRFSENHKDLCFGCEYDKEVCDYSIILTKINSVIGAVDET